jgi:copper transport protein
MRVAAIVVCLAVSAGVAYAHAALLRSTPAANSHLAKPPESIRLVFSEQVIPDLSQITLGRPDGSSAQLQVANDPHDVHALIGRVAGEFTSGRYRISWRVISADGHPVGGSFSFCIATAGDSVRSGQVTPPPGVAKRSGDSSATDTASSSAMETPEQKPIPMLASLFRGLGLGALMTGVGLLFFGVTSGERRKLAPRSLIVRSIAVGAMLLVAHLIAWLSHVSPSGSLSADFVGSVLGSTVGRTELLRTVLAVLTLWAIALARRDTFALILGAACLVVSGGIGHPAAIDPYWAIPAKALHLLAASAWLGGLIWIVWLARCDDDACRIEARRVSSVALVSIIAIFVSGLVQTVLFLNSPGDLIHSGYGRLVLAKMVGLAILIALGAYNRFGVLPQLDASDGTKTLSRSVKQEIAIVTVVIIIGGFLAYTPTPPAPQSAMSAITGISR